MNSIDPLRFIVQLYASSVAAAEILSHFATRQRNRRTETVRRLKQVCGNGTTRQAVIAVLRQLESHGATSRASFGMRSRNVQRSAA